MHPALPSHHRSSGRHLFLSALVCLLSLSPGTVPRVRAQVVRVAVAANFASTLEALTGMFARKTGHKLSVSAASSGQLFAQVQAGAPFDIFLSADKKRPQDLIQSGHAVAGSSFVYAQGKLVLWSPTEGLVDDAGTVLEKRQSGVLAMADPRTAPYGAAAQRLLQRRGLYERLRKEHRLSISSSVTQVYQYVQTGSATLGFVALSQVVGAKGGAKGSFWQVPTHGGELDQVAVLLKRGEKSDIARAFLKFLHSDAAARAEVERHGYAVP